MKYIDYLAKDTKEDSWLEKTLEMIWSDSVIVQMEKQLNSHTLTYLW